MLKLKLNEIPKELYPWPMRKPNYEISELEIIRRDMRDHKRQRIISQPHESPKAKPIEKLSVVHGALRRQATVEIKTNQLSQEFLKKAEKDNENFAKKVSSVQQLVRVRLYQSYANTLRGKKRPNPEIKEKLATLEPYVPDYIKVKSPREKRKELYAKLNQNSSFEVKKVEPGTLNSRQRIFNYQSKLLRRVGMGDLTKNKMIQSFNDILKLY